MKQSEILRMMNYHKNSYEKYKKILLTGKLKEDFENIHQFEIDQAKAICKKVWVLYEEIENKSRNRQVTRARREISLYFREKWYTHNRIAKIIHTNHTAVLYLCKTSK